MVAKRFAKIGWTLFWIYTLVQFVGAVVGGFVAVHYGNETVDTVKQIWGMMI